MSYWFQSMKIRHLWILIDWLAEINIYLFDLFPEKRPNGTPLNATLLIIQKRKDQLDHMYDNEIMLHTYTKVYRAVTRIKPVSFNLSLIQNSCLKIFISKQHSIYT